MQRKEINANKKRNPKRNALGHGYLQEAVESWQPLLTGIALIPIVIWIQLSQGAWVRCVHHGVEIRGSAVIDWGVRWHRPTGLNEGRVHIAHALHAEIPDL